MFNLIFSAVFCFFAALFILFGALSGKRYKWQYSLARIIVVVISAVVSAVLAALISNLAINLTANLILSSGVLQEVGNILADLPTGVQLISAVLSMIVAPILFIPLFFIVKAIFNIFGKLIVRLIVKIGAGKADKKERKIVNRKVKKRNRSLAAEYFNPLGAALGGLCAFMIFCVVLIPVVGVVDFVGGVVDVAVDAIPEEEEEIVAIADIVEDVVDGADNNVGAITIKYTGGKALYGVMTAAVINGEFANFNKESALISSVADAAGTLFDETASAEAKGASIRGISPAFNKSVIVRTLVSEFCTAAGEDWKAGNSFHGIPRPEIGGDFAAITSAMIDVFATADTENIKEDLETITDALAVIVENGAADELQDNPMALLEDEQLTSDLFAAFLENERLDPMVDGVADFGVNMLLDTIETPSTRAELYESFVNGFCSVQAVDEAALRVAYSKIFDDYGIRVDAETLDYAVECRLAGNNMNDWLFANVAKNQDEFVARTEIVSADMITAGVSSITNREHEADALAHAFAVVYGMTSDLKGGSFNTKNMIGTFGPALDSFTMTETIGANKTGLVLVAVLQSKSVHSQLGMSVMEATDTANSIVENSGKKSYASVMQSLMGVIEVLEAASDKTANTKAAVDKMLENLTPEAANVMQTMSTPSVVQNYGVPEANAEPVANMISDTFGNLQDVPAEEYEKESAAVADMMNVMMSMGSGGSNGTFGGEDTDTQLTADEYVTNIMESKAMSKTVVDTVYGEGDEPKVDPMGSNRNLSEGERAELLESLNSKWNASPKDEATRRQIVAIAAMMNMVVEVTDAGVTEVVSA